MTKQAEAQTNDQQVATWHGVFDARIKAANGELGAVPTDAAYKAALLLGGDKGKRAGVEALFVAMTLRPEGATVAAFTKAGECRTANNWLTYLTAGGKRSVYGQLDVSKAGGVVTSRVNATGRKHLLAKGMGARDVDTLVAKAAKARKPATSRKRPAKAPAAEVPAAEVQQPTS